MSFYSQQIKSLAIRIGVLLLIYSVFRALFFISYPVDESLLFSERLWIYIAGIRFDLIAILYINLFWLILEIIPFPFSAYQWFKRLLMIIYLALNFFGILLSIIDLGYFEFIHKRSTAGILDIWKDVFALTGTYILDYWYLLALLIGVMYVLYYFYKGSSYQIVHVSKKHLISRSVQVLLLLAIISIGLRGGFQVKPALMLTASAMVKTGYLPYVINAPFSVFMTLGKEQLIERNDFSKMELQKEFPGNIEIKGTQNNKNVVVIILESFSHEFFGFINDRNVTYTPFLDSLASKSITFKNATSNADNSIGANTAIFASIPNLMEEPFMVSGYQANRMGGFPEILRNIGYTTHFYHGATNGSMFFDAFAASAGFENYIGRSEYDNEADFDGSWGIYDEPFLQYMANDLNQLKEPFLASFFSLSSHHPFKIPKEYEGKFEEGTLEIHKTISYTDFALMQFFELAREQKWFSNTLFVITADHTSMVELKYSKKRRGAFRVPLLLFDPSNSDKAYLDTLEAQHLDIKPTILSYLGVEGKFKTFGVDLLSPESKRYSFQQRGGLYQISHDGWILLYNGIKSKHLYNMRRDKMHTNDLLSKETDISKQLELKLKSVLQLYSERMIKDSLAR